MNCTMQCCRQHHKIFWRWRLRRWGRGVSINSQVVAVDPSHPQAKSLLNNLGGLNLNKVMERRKEPLLVPYYKLMTLEQLEEAEAEIKERAESMLESPPVLPERTECGKIIEVNEDLAGATFHRVIFTDTSQHKDNHLRSIVVRETDGVLRQATWEERDRMYQVFFPASGRKMWLPQALTDKILPSILNRMLHLNVLDLVCVQCDPQSQDYHRVHRHVYEDIEKRGCYNLLRSTRYFGNMVWHLIASSQPPRVHGLLKDMLQHQMYDDARRLIQLYMLCYPNSSISVRLKENAEINLIEDFCDYLGFHDLLPFVEPAEVKVQPS